MRKLIPLSLSIIILITISLLWDHIKLPYNNENLLVGEHYFKKFNPQNDTIRFLLFISLPSITYLVSYFFINKMAHITALGNSAINASYFFIGKFMFIHKSSPG